jgi:Fic family protein
MNNEQSSRVPDIAELLAAIDSAKAELDKKPPKPTLLKLNKEEFMVRYTYNSNAIEGNCLTLPETTLVLLEGMTISNKPLKDHLEVVGHRDAYQYLLRELENGAALTEDFVKDLHSCVLMNDPLERGNYRTHNVRISGSSVRLSDHEEVPGLMASLIKDIAESKLHPVEKAAVYHLDFERIHPFRDGNGRTGRLMMNMVLMQHGYLPIDIKFAKRDEYYRAFKSFNATNSYDEMVALVAEYELEELKMRMDGRIYLPPRW